MSQKLQSAAAVPIDKRVIRLAYVGCGFMAQNVHLPNFSSLSDCSQVALAEKLAELARKVAERFGVATVYQDHRELLGDTKIARSHGFCGDWLAELDKTQMIQTDEPIKDTSPDELLPEWLPVKYRDSYIAYLQQYTHNVNLLRFFLDIRRREEIAIRNVDVESDVYTGIVTLRLGDVRCVIESGSTKFQIEGNQ